MKILRDSFITKEIDMVPLDPSKPSIKIKNKIFPKVSRIYAISETQDCEFILDINSEIFKISSGDHLDFMITKPLFKDSHILNSENFDSSSFDQFSKELIDEFEYVMYGVIFHSGIENSKTFFYASFGGLLLKIFGNLRNVQEDLIKIDSNILLLIKKKKKGNLST